MESYSPKADLFCGKAVGGTPEQAMSRNNSFLPGPDQPTTRRGRYGWARARLRRGHQPSRHGAVGARGRLWSGVAALALSWAIGTGAYFLFGNLDAVPAAERAAAGLRNPGPVCTAPALITQFVQRQAAGLRPQEWKR
jgi:cytochrome c-type biogenesis protein CcmH/NrfG